MSFNSIEGEIEKKYDIKSKEGNWLAIKEGDNKVRLVSDDIDFGEHNDTQLKKGFICTGKETCKYCQAGDKSRAKFLVWILDRVDGKVKVAKLAYTIHKKIEKLAKSEDYAFDIVPNYDINITRTGKGLDTEYDVLAARKDTPLTKEEQKLIEETCKPLGDIIQAMKNKLLEGTKEIDTSKVLQEKPVKESNEKIVLADNK